MGMQSWGGNVHMAALEMHTSHQEAGVAIAIREFMKHYLNSWKQSGLLFA